MLTMNTYKAAEFARLAGVSVKTLQRWDRAGQLKPAARTPGNRRLYSQEQLNTLLNRISKRERVCVAYLRVSRQAQTPHLSRQKTALEQFCIAKGVAVDEWLTEIGGGLNFKRPKFTELVDRILRGEIATLVIAHQDRLARFGYDLLVHLCQTHDCHIVVLNVEALSPEQEMVQDLVTITHCFSVRLSGLRHYRQAVQKALRDDQVAQDSTQPHA
jgi:predicted site-specific integrase-resolvase